MEKEECICEIEPGRTDFVVLGEGIAGFEIYYSMSLNGVPTISVVYSENGNSAIMACYTPEYCPLCGKYIASYAFDAIC